MWHLLAREFPARGHDVTHVSRCYPEQPERETKDGVRHVRVEGFDTPAALWKLKLMDLVYSRRCAKVLPRADIIVTSTFWLPMFPSICRKGAVYVDVQRMPKGQMRFYGRAARLRANSKAVAKAIQGEVPWLANRVAMIPNLLPFPPVPEEKIRSVLQRPKILLFVGRVHPEKGLDLLVEGFRLLDPMLAHGWKVHIVGPWSTAEGGGGDAYVGTLRRLAEGLPVEFFGSVHDPAALAAHYDSASIFVYPSVAAKGESFGLAPLEAMAHGGVPVVSKLECFQDFIQDGVNGVTFDHEASNAPGELANVLARLMDDPSLLARLARQAAQVNQSHAPAKMADLFLEDFAAILALQSRSPIPA
jgi:glycosyltransferase involved in cell wall biosynthesis